MFELPPQETPPIKKALQYGMVALGVMVYIMLLTVVTVASWYFTAYNHLKEVGET